MSRRPCGCPGVVGRPYRMSGSGWVALPDAREWSGVPCRCQGEFGRLSRMSGRPSRMSGNVLKALSNVRECSEGYP